MTSCREWLAAHPEHNPDPDARGVSLVELARRIASGHYTASHTARDTAQSALELDQIARITHILSLIEGSAGFAEPGNHDWLGPWLEEIRDLANQGIDR